MEQRICSAVSMPTRSRIVVGYNDGSTRTSDDLGRHWRKGPDLVNALRKTGPAAQYNTYAYWVQDVAFADARNGFASTRGGGTWRTSDAGLSWTQERSHECDYYPFGIGEIAAPTRDRAITGGPQWISTRIAAAQSVGGCAGPQPQAPDLTASGLAASDLSAPVARAGLGAVRADGSLVA
jgi:hypothetical protein